MGYSWGGPSGGVDENGQAFQFKRKFLPFYKRFWAPIRERRKRFTLRNEVYGQPGEVVDSPVGPLRILSLRQATPAWVRDNLWADEGCTSPEDFEKVWREIHPRAPEMDRPRWLHEFEPVGNLAEPAGGKQ
jgi:hypothetical protein